MIQGDKLWVYLHWPNSGGPYVILLGFCGESVNFTFLESLDPPESKNHSSQIYFKFFVAMAKMTRISLKDHQYQSNERTNYFYHTKSMPKDSNFFFGFLLEPMVA